MKIEKRYRLIGELNKVKTIFHNLEYYGIFHPLIRSVKKIENGITNCVEYRIKERPYSWIPIPIMYSAEVKSFENKIEYKIKGIPFTEPQIRYEINQLSEAEINLKF